MINKFIKLSCLVFFSSGLLAQTSTFPKKVPVLRTAASNLALVSKQKNNAVSSFTSIYTQDFASGVPAGWVITDSAGIGEVWSYDTDGPSGFSAPPNGIDVLASTTAANGFMIMDDDYYGSNNIATMTQLISTAINCAANPFVKIRFQEFYRQYNFANPEAILLVSNDSITWTAVYHAENGLANNDASPNPNNVEIDISSIAANQPTVYIKFLYRGDDGYYWEIDDIEIFQPATIDVAIAVSAIANTGCTLSSNTPVSVQVINKGEAVLTALPVSYTINALLAVNDTISGPINPGDTLLFTFVQPADLSAPGAYTITVNCAIPNDSNLLDNTASTIAHSYASNNLQLASYSMGFEPTDDISGWKIEDVDGDGISFDTTDTYTHNGVGCLRKLDSNVPDNNWIFTTCFDLFAGTNYNLDFWYKNFELTSPCQLSVFVATQNTYTAATQTVVICPIPTDTMYQAVSTTFSVAASGTYYFGFHFYTNNAGSSSMRVDDINIPMLMGINNNNSAAQFNAFPNPSNGTVTISGIEKSGSVTVLNQMGQVVLMKSFSNLNNAVLDLNNQATGLYHIQIKSGSTVSNQTINISR